MQDKKIKYFENKVDKIIKSHSAQINEIVSNSPASEETKNLVLATANETKYAINQIKQEIINLFSE